jgi:hypothetical protein
VAELVSQADILDVLKDVQRNKTGGCDGIPPALLYDLRQQSWFVTFLHHMCNVFVRHAFWPEEWNRILIAPIPKPGKSPGDPASYRPIHLICVLAKCLASLVDRRLRALVRISVEQLGFQAGCGTRDNAFVLRELIRKYRSSKLFVCFVDFKMAFDSIDRTMLFDKLARIPGIDPVWINMLKAMYSGVRASVKGSPTWFNETIGVKQGDPLSPLLFLLYIHDLPAALFPDSSSAQDATFRTELAGRLIRCLLYADDLALPSRNAAGLQTLLNRLEDYCRTWKLTVNVPKTQVVVFDSSKTPNDSSALDFKYAGETIACVPKFKYVGVWFHANGSARDTMTDVLAASRRALYSCIGRATRLGPVPVSLKVKLFDAYVRPVMLYCAEAMPYTQTVAASLDRLQLSYLRWCLGKLPDSSPRNCTLAEVGQQPVSYQLRRARINYYLLVKSRPTDHITTAALNDARRAKQKRENWWHCVQADMDAWGCSGWHTAVQLDVTSRLGKAGRSAIASATKFAGRTAWAGELLHGPPTLPSWLDAPGVPQDFSDVCMLPIHVRDGRTTGVYKSLFCNSTTEVGRGRAAKYVGVQLPERTTRAFAQFRIGIAPLRVHTATWGDGATVFPDRTCTFCVQRLGRRVVEDPYHVCMECPLYERLRARLFGALHSQEFDASNVHSLQDMFASLLSVGQPAFIRLVGRYLVDCLAARDKFLGIKSKWHAPQRARDITLCVDSAPTTCALSLAVLLTMAPIDASTCAPLSAHLKTQHPSCDV